jgi:hypothetical protein
MCPYPGFLICANNLCQYKRQNSGRLFIVGTDRRGLDLDRLPFTDKRIVCKHNILLNTAVISRCTYPFLNRQETGGFGLLHRSTSGRNSLTYPA